MDIETSEGIIAVTEPGKALVVTSRGMKEFQIIGSEPAAIAPLWPRRSAFRQAAFLRRRRA